MAYWVNRLDYVPRKGKNVGPNSWECNRYSQRWSPMQYDGHHFKKQEFGHKDGQRDDSVHIHRTEALRWAHWRCSWRPVISKTTVHAGSKREAHGDSTSHRGGLVLHHLQFFLSTELWDVNLLLLEVSRCSVLLQQPWEANMRGVYFLLRWWKCSRTRGTVTKVGLYWMSLICPF